MGTGQDGCVRVELVAEGGGCLFRDNSQSVWYSAVRWAGDVPTVRLLAEFEALTLREPEVVNIPIH